MVDDLASRGGVEQPKQVEECAFAHSGVSEDGEDFPRPDGQRDTAQHVDGLVIDPVLLVKIESFNGDFAFNRGHTAFRVFASALGVTVDGLINSELRESDPFELPREPAPGLHRD